MSLISSQFLFLIFYIHFFYYQDSLRTCAGGDAVAEHSASAARYAVRAKGPAADYFRL